MPFKNSYSLQKRKYAQISVKKRLMLINLVIEQGKTLAQASRKLNIKPSTAKLIVKKYQQTGAVFMKRLKNTAKPRPEIDEDHQIEDQKIKIEEEESPIYRKMEEGFNNGPQPINQLPYMYYNYCGWPELNISYRL